MTLEEFQKKLNSINYRKCERCCKTCGYGTVNLMGSCFCHHPYIQKCLPRGLTILIEGEKMMTTEKDCVCDKWEEKRS